jgi:hypothetical protein
MGLLRESTVTGLSVECFFYNNLKIICRHLKPFDIRILPRSEDHLALIESEHYDT